MATLIYRKNGTTHTVEDIDIDEGVTLEEISSTEVWTLTTKDDSPATYATEFVGGRPNDR